ncbi:MAG: inorganic phosphate transporter [Prolixibacteraceae bacterium]|mgnify:CR=1 FL=1|jgi:phosphate/sulfate permease|nr:inorganic phosphate transporter [Prolixibacteraceae bacterium]MBT6006006.1 inorganic phosphate transporter [Prolixibacteraceae bacterium]MBT6762928.1 inorganic phosphate transporter [Prolixibacteraceae bacterium]MBT7000601.1 inorganic phosphate transporter [Prolixibacteraceae bacterium]MBT7396977.1 inorganic phosphate transporter [Prolixibacteraceae bacterium]
MENFYLILVVVLFALAISDLIVGVSNDAVNFLNSAIGSKAAPKWLIFLLAGLGVLIGATFSTGMMEVARKGIFHPDMFFFSEIMIIFLAVMITDVILLDMFNTFGLPTSTTVSIVFELLGSAVAVSMVKIKSAGGSFTELSNYINSEKALAIITGILLSVFIAFTVGAIIQYITRLIFSFNYRKPMKYLGSAFGGLAITAITYFILIKGMKGSAFAEIEIANGEMLQDWVSNNTGVLLFYTFVAWVILIQLLKWIFNIKILKIVVLAGTFALAMAFAGNDLVNFIGVPLAGFSSFKAWVASGAGAPDSFSMEMLAGAVGTPTFMLLIAGLIMIVTLIFSKKAKSVITTTLDLSRQNEGTERFGSSLAARLIVRSTTQFNKTLLKIVPGSLTNTIQSRFTPVSLGPADDPETPAFDKLRAAVNLVVASILISIGTSLKLPLSTTYVTFMVAMGTSLSDRAWDRDSAVYRVSGVFAVIGGWFMTALIAFTVSGVIALLISMGGNFMIFVFVAIAIFMVLRTHTILKKRTENETAEEEDSISESDASEEIIEKSSKQVLKAFISTNQIISFGIDCFLNEDLNGLKKAELSCSEFSKKAKKNKDKAFSTFQKLTEGTIDTSHFYVQIMDYKREMAHAVSFMLLPMVEHLDNNHKPFTDDQIAELKDLIAQTDVFFNYNLHTVKEEKFDDLDNLISEREKIFEFLDKIEKSQIKRIKNKEVNTRNSQLFFKIIAEIRNLLLLSINLVKSKRDFITFTRQTN